MNNGKYHTKSYKVKQAAKTDRKFGIIKDHTKICVTCQEPFTWKGRDKTKQFEKARFCSRGCASYRGEGITYKRGLKNYATICFAYFGKMCVHCGHDKVVSAHHIDGNHENDAVSNLVPLCMNCHQMIHTHKFKHEIETTIEHWLPKQKIILEQLGMHAVGGEEVWQTT